MISRATLIGLLLQEAHVGTEAVQVDCVTGFSHRRRNLRSDAAEPGVRTPARHRPTARISDLHRERGH